MDWMTLISIVTPVLVLVLGGYVRNLTGRKESEMRNYIKKESAALRAEITDKKDEVSKEIVDIRNEIVRTKDEVIKAIDDKYMRADRTLDKFKAVEERILKLEEVQNAP